MRGRTLVVYYSLSGTTRRVAETIADLLGADLDEIEDPSDRRSPLGYLRSVFEALAKGLPAIRSRRDPRQYDLVVLGTPVWAGTMASPMRSYLFSHRDALEHIACFCTMGGRGAQAALREMQALCGVEGVPTYSVAEKDVSSGRFEAKLRGFIGLLGAASEVSAASHAA